MAATSVAVTVPVMSETSMPVNEFADLSSEDGEQCCEGSLVVTMGADAALETSQIADKDITIDENSYPSGPKPIYPIDKVMLKELLKGPTVNIFVGSRPNLNYVFPMPKALLAYFSPVLRQDLESKTETSVIIFHNGDKKAVSSILRWMRAGGKDISHLITAADTDLVHSLTKRFQIVTELGIGGPATNAQTGIRRMQQSNFSVHQKLYEDVKALIFQGKITMTQLDWMFSPSTPLYIRVIARNLAQTVVNAILNGTMTNATIPGAKDHPRFNVEVKAMLVSKTGWLYKMQRVQWIPLTQFQVSFIYAFTEKDCEMRRMVARDLLYLMDWGCVPNMTAYHNFGKVEESFHEDMEHAITERAAYLRAEKTARRQN